MEEQKGRIGVDLAIASKRDDRGADFRVRRAVSV